MEVRNIKLLLAYDGTNFSGWQVQKKQRSVQGVLEIGLSEMHRHPVRVKGAGRTDSGVHAKGQIANFFTDLDSIEAEKFADAINTYLPKDVRVLKSEEKNLSFDARYSAIARLYRYYIHISTVDMPHYRNFCIRKRKMPDIVSLNEMASVLTGKHDFSAFTRAGDACKSRKRIIYSSVFFVKRNFLVYQICANAYCWKMIRSIVGTILECEEKGIGKIKFNSILESRDRGRAGTTAPAKGLFLERVIYDYEEL